MWLGDAACEDEAASQHVSAVVVPAEAILAFLKSKGFTERDAMKVRGNEIVYERAHKADSRYKVLIYTSVRRGATVARGIGKDAIRVCAIFEQGSESRGICKLPRVHRTGTVDGVLARVIERAREAYQKCCDARPKRNHARCPPPIIVEPDSALEKILAPLFDAIQQKHHPGSRPNGAERALGDTWPEDEIDES